MGRTRNCVISISLLVGTICAQESLPSSAPNPTDNGQAAIAILTQQVKDLQNQTSALRQELEALRAERTATAVSTPQTAPPPNPDTAPAPETTPALQSSDSSPDLSTVIRDLHGIRWRGFGEVNYKVLDQRQPELATYGFDPGSAGNFYTGDFGLFLSSKLTDRASVLSEVIFEEGDAQSFTVDVRRLLLKYEANDHFKMSLGRFQTSIGYYNWAYLSASWLQTTADRPLVMEYAANGGLLPTQAVGVSVTGALPSHNLGLNYSLEYGSSDTIRPDINGSGLLNDERNGNFVNAGLFVRPGAVRGLQAGASIYHDRISDSVVGPSIRFGQTIVNGYAVYTGHGIEFLNEGFLIRHALEGNSLVFNTPAFYSQISRKIGPVHPFFRYQYVNANIDNTIYNDVGLRYGPSFGLRYDLNDNIALKAQLDHTVRRNLPDLNGLHLQMAFTF